MNVGSIVFEPAPVFMKPVDHSIFFTPSPQPAVTTGKPMQLYCYIKQLDDVRAFLTKLGVCKYVCPIRSAWEVERLGNILRGQVFVQLSDHDDVVPIEMELMAESEGMNILDIWPSKPA